MRRKDANRILLYLLLLLSLAGCSTKKSTSVSTANDVQSAGLVSSSPAVAVVHDCFSANVRLSAFIGNKQFSSSGTLRVKREEGVQVGITPLGLVEVACIEFLPAEARFIYKLGKEFASVPYSSVPFLQRSGIGYSMLESLFMNRLFLPAGNTVDSLLGKAHFVQNDKDVVASIEADGISYSFTFDRATGNLVRSEGMHSSGIKVSCCYSDFEPLDGRPFPHTLSFEASGTEKPVSLLLKLSNLKTKDFCFSPRKISSSYDEIGIDEVMKLFGNM